MKSPFPGVTNHSLISVGIAAVAVLSAACGGSASTTTMAVTGPSSDMRCQATASTTPSSFTATGGAGTIRIAIERECPWTLISEAPWIVIISGQAQGDASVPFSVASNDEPVARQGTIRVAQQQLSVSQGGAPCRFEVWGAPPEVAASGGQITLTVRTHPVCTWTATGTTSGVTPLPASGRGDASIQVSVGPNSGPARAVTLIVSDVTVTTFQTSTSHSPAPSPQAITLSGLISGVGGADR